MKFVLILILCKNFAVLCFFFSGLSSLCQSCSIKLHHDMLSLPFFRTSSGGYRKPFWRTISHRVNKRKLIKLWWRCTHFYHPSYHDDPLFLLPIFPNVCPVRKCVLFHAKHKDMSSGKPSYCLRESRIHNNMEGLVLRCDNSHPPRYRMMLEEGGISSLSLPEK